MKIEFFEEFVPPTTTVQQRRQNSKGGYLHDAGRKAKALWKAVLEKHAPEKPIAGPICLCVSVVWPHTKKNRNAGVLPKTTRPDGDNVLKMVKDVMTECGYWKDDAQVYWETIIREYGIITGVHVMINTDIASNFNGNGHVALIGSLMDRVYGEEAIETRDGKE